MGPGSRDRDGKNKAKKPRRKRRPASSFLLPPPAERQRGASHEATAEGTGSGGAAKLPSRAQKDHYNCVPDQSLVPVLDSQLAN